MDLGMKSPTTKQLDLIERIERYLAVSIKTECFYVKNKVIGVWVDGLQKRDIANIELFGLNFGGFSVVSGGAKKINIVLK
jgi:hypothetical protein